MDTIPLVEPELLLATFSPTGHRFYCNDAWRDVLGEDWSLLGPEEVLRVEQYLKEASRGSLVTNQLFLVQTAGREDALPLLLNLIPVHTSGTDSDDLYVAAVTVTAEILREPGTWAQNQTERARIETLGRMTMGIAHDFNNLLSGILGYTELLKNYEQEELVGDVLDDHLRTIEQAALDGAALIRKIQQYIRQEKHTHHAPLDVPTLIQDCIELTRPYWYNEPRRKGISIEIHQEFDDVPPVMGSATELREVFLNLILNAVQAMPDGGVMIFRTHLTEAGLCITAADTGSGMSESVRRRIFEPLFTTKGERGTGMGLAVAYGIVQEHEGTIRVESKLGHGTTFTILFPPAREIRVERPRSRKATPGRSARILVIDDERMVRTILVKLLSLKGHSVASAESGPEGLRLLHTHPFDVVFTDLGMPEMNGREFARLARQQFPKVPIILLTGDTEVGEARSDVDLVMAKPFKIDELEETVQNFLRP